MKKLLLISLALISTFGMAQTAVDFTANDCSGNSHTLFTELNSGKVIVLCWVMPCGSCISSASIDASTVKNMSNPNVVFYLVDDAGNTSCSSLNSWASTNSITTNASFGNSGNNIKMKDYGSTAMNKTVVLGGSNHHVYYNHNSSVSQGDLQTAINDALLATNIKESENVNMNLSVFPNPVSLVATINYSLAQSADVTIEVMNTLGEMVSTVSFGNQPAGKQEYRINLESLSFGVYFVKLNAGNASETTKLIVTQ